ncbi:hypothetical protein J1C67_19275 (plasmid) [Clostridium gasigenes]|uniref:hypothetical protein n=1 Tax=Clostridium gasigenes TaxID=94869 RepID=UPI00143863F9|nr:hypothetical protein [Clostridium gasigenes]NKF08818.1 hypothetical protein [Clostridium gasigenes]QSW21544.1 hypothetical protein J1C67_19275 [Clostridium gasigenes]
MKSSIRLEGILDSEVKLNNDGKYVVIVKSNILNKENSESIFFVEMTKNQWNGIKNKENNLIITGHIIVKKNKKDIPFIYVISTGINEVKRQEKKKVKNVDKVIISSTKKEIENKPERIFWFENIPEDQFILVNANDITMVESCHINFTVKIHMSEQEQSNKPICIRALDNGEYVLVAGLHTYIRAKLLNTHVKAFVTELSRKEFVEKYNLTDLVKTFIA